MATPLYSYVQWNVPQCKPPLACWRAEAAWALAIILCDCKDVTRVLTQEWVLSIRAAKTSTWALTGEWALAWDTTVVVTPSSMENQQNNLALSYMILSILSILSQNKVISSSSNLGISYRQKYQRCAMQVSGNTGNLHAVVTPGSLCTECMFRTII